MDAIYEAIVDCDDEGLPGMLTMSGNYDPVERIIIQTAFRSYEIDPARVRSLVIRRMA